MKKLKDTCKRTVAMIMTVALMSGMCLVENKDVEAATGNVLTLGEGVDIVSMQEEVFSFTAPESGTYYFYSKSESSDPFATLVTETGSYENDDTNGFDFMIEAELSKDEECELIVNAYETMSGLEYETTIYVCDEAAAQKIICGTTGGGEHYTTVGEAYEFNLQFMYIAGDTVEELPEGYSVKWFKGYDDGLSENMTDLNRTGNTYTISEVLDTYFNTAENGYPYYCAVVYDNDVEMFKEYFYLFDIEKSIYIYDEDIYANVGDEVTLTLSARDYEGNIIDLEGKENYTYKWYKSIDYLSEELEETGYNYTFEVTEEDFYGEETGNIHYIVELYIDDEYISRGIFYVYNKEYTLYAEAKAYYATIGENIVLAPEIYYYDGEPVTVDDTFSFEWYKLTREEYYMGEYGEAIGNEETYVINEVAASDFCDESTEYVIYICKIYRNDIFVTDQYVDIFDVNIYWAAYGGEYYVSEGDTVTLTPSILDAYDNEISLDSGRFEFSWFLSNNEEIEKIYEESSGTLIIDAVTTDEMYIESEDGIQNKFIFADIYDNVTGRMERAEFFLCKAEEETTTVAPTTKVPETTTVAPTTKAPETTTVAPTTEAQKVKAPAKAKIKKVTPKKKASKVVKLSIKKIKGANGYQVQISKAKKFTKKNILVNKKSVKKLKPSIKSKKLKNKKKLFVRVRAYAVDSNGKKIYGKWSKIKNVKIK